MRAALTLSLALVLLGGRAAAAEASATEALKARDAEIRAALPPRGGAVTPEVRRKLETIITRAVDLRSMVEAAMGKHWAQTPDKQRRRLIGAFESRFRKASGGELDTYRSTQIEYQPEVEQPNGTVQVPTKVVVKGEPTEIAYTVKKEGAGWRIVDITVDGVSTVENYRSSFARIISKEGVNGLIARLEKGGGGPATRTGAAAR
jgi:phospholipid transport system substrate-binding protein